MDTKRRTKSTVRIKRKKSVVFHASGHKSPGRRNSKDTSTVTVREISLSPEPVDELYFGEPREYEDIEDDDDANDEDEEGGVRLALKKAGILDINNAIEAQKNEAGVVLDEAVKVDAIDAAVESTHVTAHDAIEAQKNEPDNEIEKPLELAFHSLGMDVTKKILPTGLEEIK